MKMLLAVDGSKYSLDAVKCLIEHADWYRDKPEVELLFVHAPVPKLPGMSKVVGKNQIQRYYAEEGAAALAEAKKLLERAGIRYRDTLLVGQPADEIVKHAEGTRCDLIFVGTHGRTAAGNMLLGSVATKVLHSATVPVMLVR
jgi:nucleotide-binding universal stress UspA family protein